MKLSLTALNPKGLLLTVGILFASIAFGQVPGVKKCATVEMDSIRRALNPNIQSDQEFEDWLAKLITEKKEKAKSSLIIGGVYQIPVVVHVVHNGEAVGTGRNISDAAIQTQIDVLNEDFRRLLGTAGYNTHPDGADTKIEFCLARRRPDGTGFPGTDGINRINRNSVGWTAPPHTTGYIDGTIKPYCTGTQFGGWDAAEYMNFWVCDISGGILGYAQFPTTALGGMGCGAQSVNTDGVVMLYSSIGKSSATGFPGPYNEGRTATHEIGHWLGLRHIWGDGGCGVDDFCADTPLSDAANFGCPTTNSCADPAPDPNDMVANYMDYSDDACMNIFTNDQKMRMRTVLENSPIRASLINSDACIPPAVSDASIINITKPSGDNCAGSIIPTVVIRNRGSSTLTSATISYTIDGGTPTTFSWTGSVAPASQATVNLPAFTATLGVHEFKSYSTLPNGVTDPDPTYDTSSIVFAVSNGYQPNYSQDFEASVFPPDLRWSVVNPNNDCYEWIGQTCTSSTGVASNSAAMMPNYENGTGQDEYLYTPFFILPCNATAANLTFDKAYRRRANGVNDRLRVEISEDCGATWNAVTLFDQAGTTLQTVTTVSNTYWIPSAAGNWANVNINLMPYVTGTSKNVQFRFRATNAGNGGNLYVDNVNFTAVTPGEIGVTVSGVDVLDGGYYNYGATPVGSPTTATFTITNSGTSNLVLTGPIVVTGAQFALNATFGTTTVPAGGTTTFSVNFTPPGAGPYTGNVSFGTNDCDEGTFNFQLIGSGSVTPAAAEFSATPRVLCGSGTATYTDASIGATSWAWTFPGGTPATATGVGPHAVTYAAPGTYNAQLIATNAFGSDTELKTGYITVLPGTGATLPITEGFNSGTFPPTNWTIGNGGNQTVTWAQSNTIGTAPTAGNSTVINLFTTNTTGNQDSLFVEPANLAGFTTAQMTFDVAYARYNATYSDRLQVLVSTDCGATWAVVYDKAGTVLATDPDQTGAYTAPATWRNETVNLTPYIGNSKVQVAFNSISGYGQYIYLDNVNITGVGGCVNPTVPTVTATPASVCTGGTSTLNITGTLNDATVWSIYTGSCGGTLVGTTATSSFVVSPTGPSTTYYVRGTGGCVSPGTCASVTVNVTPTQNPGFSYGAPSYCTNGSNPTPTITGVTGGTFTRSPAGLSINASTGAINLGASTPGTYTVTYTTAGPCPGTSNVSVTINAAPTAPTISASGSTTFCSGGSVTLTSSQATGNVWSTGATTQSIVVSTAGSYTVTFTNGSGCSATSAATTVTVNANPTTPTISASGSTTFCAGGSVTLTSSQATGNVWSTGATTQSIVVSAAGSYTVTFTNGSGCSATSAATTVTVNANPTAPTISASGPTTFCAGGSVTLTSSQATGNVWSTGATTQSIVVSTAGSYTVTFTNGSGCSATSAATTVTVNANPTTPTISASGSTTFCAGGSVTLTSSQATGNVWSTGATTQSIVVSTAGLYTVTFTNGNGCSATSAATTVTVNANPTAPTISASGSTTFCSGGSVTLTSSQATGNVWSTGATTQSIVVSTAGSYTVTFTNGSGCSATSAATTVTVNANPTAPTISASGSTTFCTGGSVTLTSSQATGNVWSTGATTQSIVVSTAGSYTVTFTNGSGCSATSAATTVTVNANPTAPTISASGSTTFCTGGSVTLTSSQATGNVWSTGAATQSIVVSAAGSYTVTFTNGSGCSATSAATTVTVNANPTAPTISASGSTTFCSGGSVTLTSSQATGNVWSTGATTQSIVVSTAGSYTVTFTNGSGCSATSAATTVTVNANPTAPTISASGSTTFCSGGSVTLTSSQATGNVWSTGATTQSIVVSTAGSYTVTFTNGSGCSATSAATTVTVNANPTTPTISASGSTTFCAGGSVTLTSSQATGNVWSTGATTQSIVVSTAGSYTVTFTNGSGCSATSAATTVTLLSPTSGSESVTACGSYTWAANGTTYNASGAYTATLTNAVGCDSTATLNLTISTFASGTDVITACDSYLWIDGTTYSASNNTATFTYVGGSVNGCDSIVTLNLTINNSTTSSQSVAACNNYTWSANGTTYTASGSYTATLTNAAGCDSVATLNLTINTATSGSENVTACNNYTWSANGTTYNASGVYTATLTNSAGCDSLATLNLTINTATSGSENVTACNNYTWSANGTTYNASGSYTAILTNAVGCDSLATLNLTINTATSGSENVTACNNYTWSANGTTYNASGVYTATLTNAVGCDSLATLSLTINTATSGSENVTACNNYTWSANGTTYNASGSYTATLTNAAGCDSLATLNLTINTATSGSENVTACNNYTWSANGTTYNASGSYTATLTNAAGCDSVATLNLTISTFASGTDVITACDSYLWIDGTTYSASNSTATHTLVGGSVNGCDSIVTLNLTINNSTSSSQSVTACNNYTWSANGTTYTASGVYTATLTNAAGCDSVATLNLTINTSTSGGENVTACGSYTWPANGMTYSTSGFYLTTLTNAAGCDSTAILDLTIATSVTSTDVIVACDSYTWIDGVTYTTSNNTAMQILLGGSVTGCDSIVSLDLTINNSTTGSETAANCGSYTWSANGTTYTSTGLYTAVLTNNAGCDSTVTLDLTIYPTPTVTIDSIGTFCDVASDFTLSGGTPAGGTYSGVGVAGGMFSPSSAGVGTHTVSYAYTNSDGCTGVGTMDVIVEDCSSIDELTLADLLIYPNPTTSVVYVSCGTVEINTVKVFDGAGRLVATLNVHGSMVPVDLSDYARGVYSIEISAGGYQVYGRVVKQ